MVQTILHLSLEISPVLTLYHFTVSVVDGYNLPVRVTNNVGCSIADCPIDLGPNCGHAVIIFSA